MGKYKSISGFLKNNLIVNPLFFDPETIKLEISLIYMAFNISKIIFNELLNLINRMILSIVLSLQKLPKSSVGAKISYVCTTKI